MTTNNAPSWLASLTQAVSMSLVPIEVMPPLGCHCFQRDGLWEVTIFAALTEVIGGERDGFQFPAEFILDLGEILSLFSDVSTVQWQALPHEPDDEIGAHVAIEGDYEGHRVLLRIPAQPPARFEIGRYANVSKRRFVNVW